MIRYILLLAFLISCKDRSNLTHSSTQGNKVYDSTSFTNSHQYDSLLERYSANYSSIASDIRVYMVIDHIAVDSYFVYTLVGNDSLLRCDFSIVNKKERVMSFEKSFFGSQSSSIADSLDWSMKQATFWELDNKKINCDGADGTLYYIIANINSRENVVIRWSPEACNLLMAREFLDLVDQLLSLVGVEKYQTKYFD